MAKPSWSELAAKHGPQLPPVRPGQFAPKVEEPACSRCGKRRKVARVTRREIVCAVCAALDAEYGEVGG